MISFYLCSLIGCMFVGSFVMYSAYLADERKRFARLHLRSLVRRQVKRPLTAQRRRFVPYALSYL